MSLTAGVSNEQVPAMPRTVSTPVPILSPTTKIMLAPVTHHIMITIPTQFPEEAKVNDKAVFAIYFIIT
jgi:hypothetical protein